ncbi:hypothetical protein FB567DRAFT_516869 [Paraphoma chrysanthemicola]|uniref:GA4 desaturase n=1 Tax=Paraphoma chrysanthemicola TaxID=798071 RepID=A0A8K0RGL3_9PLEO|nr:hypothetical protein FB567DRAFT_516869 [Paraphoma chrysanthemicola]
MDQSRRDSHSGDVTADINYFPALGTPIPKSAWKTRYLGDRDGDTRSMVIRDVRMIDKTFGLDAHGFQYVHLPPKQRVTRDSDEDTIKREYYSELETIAKDLTGASTAHVFNHVIRAHSSPNQKGIQDAYGRWQDIPSGHPHVDYAGDPSAIAGTLQELNFPAPIAQLFSSSSRYCFLGAWRPLKMVTKDPLAVCDSTTVPDEDYQVRLREFSRTGIKSANYVLSHGAAEQKHEWWYMSEMQPDELVVFKGLDTKRDEPGWRCGHTAFRVEGTEGEEPRESIEARIVCFWD